MLKKIKFMSYFEIIGGKKLNGEIEVKGAKNAALKAVAAALLSRGKMDHHEFSFY